MKKNILSYIVAGIFIFFIVYFGASIVIDHINEKNSTDEGGSPSIGNDPSVEIKEITYTVVFNANDGSDNYKEQDYLVSEEKALLTNEFSRTGYTFTGWSTTTTGKVEYTDCQVVKELTEHSIKFNLYAVWEANSYTVKFDGNGAEGSMTDLEMNYDSAKQLTANSFEKIGYTFTGWNTNKDGTGTSYADKESINNLLTSGEMTLYAQWAEHTYKVIYNANNGSEDKNEQVFGFEDEKALTSNTYNKEGYSFEGWSTTSTGRVEYTDGQVVSKLTTEDNSTINLYAVWQANAYTVKYDANGGEGTIADQSRTYDDEIALSNNTFTRVGYTFTGWEYNDNSYTNRYVGNLTSVDKNVVTLVAKWEEHNYKIVYNANNGTDEKAEQHFTYSEEKKLLANEFEVVGYTFIGWSTTSTGRKEYDDEQVSSKLTAIDEDVINLYAVWTANTYTINFDGNGANRGTMASQTRTYNDNLTISNNTFIKDGYTFGGWLTLDNTSYENNQSGNLTTLNNVTITLKAKWIEHTYKVIFNSNNDSAETKEQNFMYSNKTALLENTFEKDGYTFIGWALSSDGNVYYEDTEIVCKLTPTNNQSINLYAIWQANTYTIKFDKNGGSGTMSNLDMTYDVSKDLLTNKFSKTGYSFLCWNSQSDGSGTSYEDKQTVKNLLETGSITLYAQWSINTYDFTYNYKGNNSESDSYEYGKEIIKTSKILEVESAEDFDKWVDGNGNLFTFGTTMNEGGITIYAIYKNESTVTFNYNGSGQANTLVSGYVGNDIVQPSQNPTREGYNFIGWYTTPTCEALFNFYTTKMSENGITIYAGWSPISYVVKYDGNEGSGTLVNQNRTFDDNAPLTKNTITRTGYTFDVWVDENGNEYEDEFVGNLTSTNNAVIVLKAKWIEHTYKVTFNSNNNTNESKSQTFTYTEEKELLENTYSYTGYTFIGWSTNKDATEKEYTDKQLVHSLTDVDNATYDLYAIWKANSYVVEFNANGGIGSIDNQNRSYNDNKSLPTNETISRIGYTFDGWVSIDDKYYEDGYTGNLTSLDNTTITLYAKWIEHTYEVIFHANNGTNASNEQSLSYSQVATLTPNVYEKLGFTFVGWAESETGSKKYDDKASVSMLTSTNNGEYHLYAVWVENEYTIIYNANDDAATGSMLKQVFTYTEEKSLLENEFVKKGYKLDGWALSPTGEVIYTDQQTLKNLSSVNGDEINLYAIWSQITYKVELHANNDSSTSSIYTLKYEEKITLTNTYSKYGYKFVGWSTSKGGTKVYDNNEQVSKLTTTDNEIVNLYAIWTEIEYTIVYNANDELATGSMLNQEYTYNEEKSLLACGFNKEGYRLAGWSTTPNGIVIYTDQEIVKQLTAVDGDTINLYAIWEEITYTLQIHANNNSSSMEQYKLTYLQQHTLSNTFTRVGFTFVGYSTSEDDEVLYQDGYIINSLTTTHDDVVSLYAVWEEINRNDVALIIDDVEVTTLKRSGNVYIVNNLIVDTNNSITVINYITDKMYEFDNTVTEKAYYNVTVNFNSITISFEKTHDYIERGEYNEEADSVEGVDTEDLSGLKNVFDSITSSYTIETQTFFNPAAIDIINDIYATDYKQHNVIEAKAENDTTETFTLFDVNSAYVDTYGATTVKYSSSYSVDYEGWTRVAENKYKCDRTEVVEHFRELLTPGLSNQGTYMTYKYVTVEINADGSLTIRLYCSTTQSGKVIAEHKDKDNKPQWYMLLSEATITNIE